MHVPRHSPVMARDTRVGIRTKTGSDRAGSAVSMCGSDAERQNQKRRTFHFRGDVENGNAR